MDWNERIDAILDQLRQLDEPLLDGVVGCTDEDIEQLETNFGYKLPSAFTALLRRIGRRPGEFMAGFDFDFPGMLDYREIAESLLDELAGSMEKSKLRLDQHDFVFLMIQGYQFFFFRAGYSDDPPVFFYDDDDPDFRQVYSSFTEWLEVCVKEELELRI